MNALMMKLLGRAYRDEGDDASAGAPSAPAPGGESDSGAVNVDTDWAAMADDSGSGDLPGGTAAPTQPSVPGTPSTEPTPAAPPATPAPAAPPATPPVEPAAPPANQPPATPTEPTPPALTPEQQAAELEQARTNYFNELVQAFQIPPEDAARLQTEPENVLPVLAARVQMQVLDAVFSTLPQRVYAMIGQHAQAMERERSAEEAMFKDYPELKPHREAVLRAGQMYRAVNPKATRQEAIKAIGDYCMQMLGIQRATPTNQTPPPVQPQNPFVPAQGGGPATPPAPPGEWDFLVEDD